MTKGNKNIGLKKRIGVLILALLMMGGLTARAQEESGEPTPADENQPAETEMVALTEPVEKQIIRLTDEGALDDWGISELETYGLRFLVRGKDALTWALSIEDGGFHNEAILRSYAKVLTIVNSLFILGLLAIALMWMFSILIPRKYLKRVILVYSLAVIFVNFALPVNQLFIDGTNLLQKTLLTEKDGSIQITDIVQTPSYAEALSYRSETNASLIGGKRKQAVTLNLGDSAQESTAVGRIREAQGETIKEGVISLSNQPITLVSSGTYNVHQEQTVFRFLLLLTTGIAYFILALIFTLRIVILWALLIISPILLLLGIFRSTRGWFVNWLSMYGRWLLIGPLTALGISLIVSIWQMSGLPITVGAGYTSEVFSVEKISNVVFYLPGKNTPNTLSNTQEMMEYIVFLLMLYLPIFLGFALTRRKLLHENLLSVSKNLARSTQTTQQQLISRVLAIQEKEEEEKRDRPTGLMDSFRKLVNSKIGFLAEAAMPVQKLKTKPSSPVIMMPSASNFLPENLRETPVPKMLELLGRQKESKASHRMVIERLAHPEKLTDRKEKEKVTAVMSEVENRARDNDRDALKILQEVQTVREADGLGAEVPAAVPAPEIREAAAPAENGQGISIQVNEAKPETDRKVRDSSLSSKSEEKNKKKPDEKQKEKEAKPEDKKETPEKPETASDEPENMELKTKN